MRKFLTKLYVKWNEPKWMKPIYERFGSPSVYMSEISKRFLVPAFERPFVETSEIRFETLKARLSISNIQIAAMGDNVENYAREELAWKLAQEIEKYLEIESRDDRETDSMIFTTSIKIGGLNIWREQ